MKKYH